MQYKYIFFPTNVYQNFTTKNHVGGTKYPEQAFKQALNNDASLTTRFTLHASNNYNS